MTANQIAYWNLQENMRSNRVREAETNRHNVVGEAIDRDTQIAQQKRWEQQSRADAVKAATGAVRDVGSTLFGKGGLIGLF